ncbi:GrlR family regulatory protein [Pseudodesulfovibrio tunisiensis]|uniref:GrlR family regulatory protein n=1 Tax=Pseudodesulfovibrio tunisiensis TaxID=463192 RepID=UPI001FB56A90|nr:GrlR family regulatory protein [Pseudodesulfovibrio tunisiensis]
MNGIYYIQFGVPGNGGVGLVVLSDGKAHGGDASYLYAGEYEGQPGGFTAKIDVSHWNGPHNNIFGNVEKISLEMEGEEKGPGLIVGSGHPVGSADQMIFEMQKLRDLA